MFLLASRLQFWQFCRKYVDCKPIFFRSMSEKEKKTVIFLQNNFFSQKYALDTENAVLKALPEKNGRGLIFFDLIFESDWNTFFDKIIFLWIILWKLRMQLWQFSRSNLAGRPIPFNSMSKDEKKERTLSESKSHRKISLGT